MRPSSPYTARTILLAAALGLALIALTLSALSAAARPAAQPLPPQGALVEGGGPGQIEQHEVLLSPDGRVTELADQPGLPDWAVILLEQGPNAPAAGVDIRQTVTSTAPISGTVLNGGYLYYTVAITNNSAAPLTSLLVLNPLRAQTFEDDTPDGPRLFCKPACYKYQTVYTMTDALGESIQVIQTRQLEWRAAVLGQVNPGQSKSVTFWGRVVGQTDGTLIRNTAFVRYTLNGQQQNGMSNETQVTAKAGVTPGQGASLSPAPTWISKDLGGTLAADWGDFDRDGDLDLALGSTAGTTIYRNDAGQLARFYYNGYYTLGVRWAELDDDGYLELIGVGSSEGGNNPTAKGHNFIYHIGSNGAVTINTFQSSSQLLRVEPGDFYGQDQVDLAVSTNMIDAQCPVMLYRNQGGGAFGGQAQCVSPYASAALAAADYDGDGRLDLALGQFPNTLAVIRNIGGAYPLTTTALITTVTFTTVDTRTTFLSYDLAWGDYDSDGFLDLAAAYPLERKARVYHNDAGQRFTPLSSPGGSQGTTGPLELRGDAFRTPLALRWGDFDGNGLIDLAVGTTPPRVYHNLGAPYYLSASTDDPRAVMTVTSGAMTGQIWALAAGDVEGDGIPDLALGVRNDTSVIFTSFASPLERQPHLVESDHWTASSVACGDAGVQADGLPELLFGAGEEDVSARLYTNRLGDYPPPSNPYWSSSFGPHAVAFGDINGDRKLETAIGTSGQIQIFTPDTFDDPEVLNLPATVSSLAFGDADGDRWLDLLVAATDGLYLFHNNQGQLDAAPSWSSIGTLDRPAIAWGDYENDKHLDFVVGSRGGPLRLFKNQKDGTFSQVWQAPAMHTAAVAWADFNGDGYLDLAVGNYGQASLLYENVSDGAGGRALGGQSGGAPWLLDASLNVTGLAWGDWNNDGLPDLAVAVDGAPLRVYTNLHSRVGSPQMLWMWASDTSYVKPSVAWCDVDGDGDLDLAFGQQGMPAAPGQKDPADNGFYANGYAQPVHLGSAGVALPNSPGYLALGRPGYTASADFYSSAELLSGPTHPTVTIQYKLYNAHSDPITRTIFEYSLNGGGQWLSATPATASAPVTMTSPSGVSAVFLWNAEADHAVSDNARFRVTVASVQDAGLVQRVLARAAGTPFRIRGTTCEYPAGVSFTVAPRNPGDKIAPGKPLVFDAVYSQGSGVLKFTWDFGDGQTAIGESVEHTYKSVGAYRSQVTVTACDDYQAKSPARTIMWALLPIVKK